ncbi:hypothetical protein CERSUDRAFT_94618 [Gelatoporia subvermispora B]|uniref:Uncharacterized protein n=1 Tax=Ceriporiopsis subvermispora (strain B) TaxID=914234 RepID=M2RFM2_CERS8|nr:hypothetical protein CERSUDRAFT_94618 [Gelatoporia subvermispora B]
MPTVPWALSSRVPADAVVSPIHVESCGLTHDQDLDDSERVAVENSNTVAEVTAPPPAQKGPLSQPARAPSHAPPTRLDTPHLALHSPSTMVSTPIGLSSRFEYPFPAGAVSGPDASPLASLPSPSANPSVLSAAPFALPTSAHTHQHRHPGLENVPRHPPIPPGLMKKRRRVGEQAPPARPSASTLQNADITARSLDRVPMQPREVQQINALLQRGLSDETVVGQEPEAKSKADANARVDAASGEAVPLAHVKMAGATSLERTSRAASETSLTDVDPAEDESAARLALDDSKDYQPRSGTASPAPADTPGSTTTAHTRRTHGCVET